MDLSVCGNEKLFILMLWFIYVLCCVCVCVCINYLLLDRGEGVLSLS